jgi:hypothetical protein
MASVSETPSMSIEMAEGGAMIECRRRENDRKEIGLMM